MIRSMTAFNRHEMVTDTATLVWEIKSVNHRYLEITTKLPEGFKEIDMAVRETCRKRLNRGKLECNLRYQLSATDESGLAINDVLAQQVIDVSEKLIGNIKNPAPLNALEILKFPGVMQTSEADFKALASQAVDSFNTALDDFISTREREGEEMKNLIESRLQGITEQVKIARDAIPEIRQKQKEKLLSRLDELKQNVDENRLEQELVFMAQKLDIDEELDRLDAHVTEVGNVLKKGGAAGRRLDFLMQELNRESNTLGSKSASSITTQVSVELKVLIEQMREQIQNIE